MLGSRFDGNSLCGGVCCSKTGGTTKSYVCCSLYSDSEYEDQVSNSSCFKCVNDNSEHV